MVAFPPFCLLPFFPFPLPFPTPSLSLPLPPHPSFPLLPQTQLGVWGSAVNSPTEVWGRAPGRNQM